MNWNSKIVKADLFAFFVDVDAESWIFSWKPIQRLWETLNIILKSIKTIRVEG